MLQRTSIVSPPERAAICQRSGSAQADVVLTTLELERLQAVKQRIDAELN